MKASLKTKKPTDPIRVVGCRPERSARYSAALGTRPDHLGAQHCVPENDDMRTEVCAWRGIVK